MSPKAYALHTTLVGILICSPAVPLSAATVAAQRQTTEAVAGAWVGQFAQADWTLEFTRKDGGWTGRYMSSKYNKWHDLQSLVVSGDSVRFDIKAQPLVTFVLTLDPTGKNLSGDVAIGNGAKVPFSASRKA